MRDGPWKLITRAKGASGGPMLFDLTDDIGEQNNLADQHPERVKQMLAAIENWKKDVERTSGEQDGKPPKRRADRRQ